MSALLTLALALATAACGGSDHESHAQSLYRAYRAAEDMRDEAENRLHIQKAIMAVLMGGEKLT